MDQEDQHPATLTEVVTEPREPIAQHWGWAALFDFLRTLAVVLLAAFLIRHFLVQPFIVDGESMQPTFQDQEYILVDKLSYRFHGPERGDVVVFHPPGGEQENFIKRVIGLPGDQVEIRGHRIFVNGQLLAEDYTRIDSSLTDTTEDTIITRDLNDNEYYVLGDNRDHSKDSRDLGGIERSRIIGRAWLVLFPIEELTLVEQPNYPNLGPAGQSSAVVSHY